MENIQVDANPTKEFFISMLTRDIPLNRSILDLIDNSVDAACASGNIDDKEIHLTIGSDTFEIWDNCGGFDIETATKYAFRFGRDTKDVRNTPNSVGQFGVGMKRTLFKLGNSFSVKSIFSEGAFKLDVDVDEWLNQNKKDWGFELTEQNKEVGEVEGTFIKVTDLFPSVIEQFQDNEFLRLFKEEVAIAYFKRINQGLKVLINGQEVRQFDITIKQSDDLGAIYLEDEFKGVKITVRAGVDKQDYHSGGWYIVCNGRLVESAEQSSKSLWGTNSIPKYHDRLAFFRGVVEFKATNSSSLPWTTTKTGVDVDSEIYRYANKLMIRAIEPILKFLNQREAERKQAGDNRLDDNQRLLEMSIQNAETVSIYQALTEVQDEFIRPDKVEARAALVGTITYQVDIERLNQVKDIVGASSASEAGKLTFDYYFDYECS